MCTGSDLSPKMLIILFSFEISLTFASAFAFLKIDSIVHSILYDFGLQFSYVWAQRYQLYSQLTLGSLGVAGVLSCIAIACAQTIARSASSIRLRLIEASIFGTTVASAVSAYFLTRLNFIVHNDLYRYGLQFSYAWANEYWTYEGLLLGLVGFIIVLNSSLISYFILKHSAMTLTLSRLSAGLLLAGGSCVLALSVALISSILALIGLGLIFWGTITLYVEPWEYVPERIAGMMVTPLLADLNQIIQSFGYHGKAFYLPHEYLKDRDSTRLYICRDADATPPSRRNIDEQQGSIFLKDLKGVVIQPPGIELARFFERNLGTKFEAVDFQFIKDNLPDLIVEDLGIAQVLQMSFEGSRIHVVLRDMTYNDMCKEVRNLPHIYGRVGCPISSALGCVFAEVTSKLVTINREVISEDGRNLDVEYLLLDERAE